MSDKTKKMTPSTLAEVTTPCFLVDIDRLKCNAERMLETSRRMKVDLRPHTKTHKTIEGAEIMTGGTRRKINCSTLVECELYADNDFEDILLAYPITADKVSRCAQLTNRLDEFHVMVSGQEGVQCLQEGSSELAAGKQWSVFLELDCGYERTGFTWDSAELLEAAKDVHRNADMKIQGLYCFCGQSYTSMTPEERQGDQKKLVQQMTGAAERLRSEGMEVPVIGTGSTPTCSLPDSVLTSLNEFHPGSYVFYDYEMLCVGACRQEDIAGCVATRVVCRRRDLNTLVVDCGFLALGFDGVAQRGDDFCIIKDHPHLRMTELCQELGKIEAKKGESINLDDYPVGTMLFIYPYHSSVTAARHNQYVVHSGQKVVDVWKPLRGW